MFQATLFSTIKKNKKSSHNIKLIHNDIIQEYLKEDHKISDLSSEAASKFLTFLEVFMELLENFEEAEDLVEVILKIFNCNKFSNNQLFCDTLRKLWKKCSIISIKEQLLKVYPKYFQELIDEVTEDFILTNSETTLNKELLNYDFNYIELCQNISQSSKLFQYFSTEIAKRMIQEDFSNEGISKLLMIILADLREKLSNADFYNLYSDNQKIYIILIESFKYHENCSNLLDTKLNGLKDDNFMDFVVIATHCGSKELLRMLK